MPFTMSLPLAFMIFLHGALLHFATCQNVTVISRKSFPPGFVFGTATSAYQVEGAVQQDGRGPSIWDTFSHKVGNIVDLSNGDVTDDQYNRFKEDIQLMANMSVDAYRFSISWSRIYPGASGSVNQLGIDHYNELINALLQAGIQPYVTLYHWDLPQALEDAYGGWLSSRVIGDFSAYAETCFNAFGDRVKHWITFNEPYNFLTQGFGGLGTQPPARCSVPWRCSGGNSSTEPYLGAHNVLLAHSTAVGIYRQKYQVQQGGSIGISLDSKWYEPLTNASGDMAASQRALDFELGWFLDPLIFGDYPASMRTLVGNRLPSFSPAAAKLVKGSFDFIGINHYTTCYAFNQTCAYLGAAISAINPDGQFSVTSFRNGEPIGAQTQGAAWLYVVPWGFKKLLDYVRLHYNNPSVIITENGFDDLNDPFIPIQEALHDDDRINYHCDYLSSLLEAIKEGSIVRGYFVWSFLDNWEWGLGFIPRFGVHFVDYNNNLERYPKDSVTWFKQFLQS